MTQVKDGWHKVYGEDVYIENGKVVRGVTKDANGSEKTCYPYKYSKDHDSWINISGEATLSSYRTGYKKGITRMK